MEGWDQMRKYSIIMALIAMPIFCAKKTADVQLPMRDVLGIAKTAYSCGLIDGTLKAVRQMPSPEQSAIVEKIVALRVESDCERIDSLLAVK
jgi:hypothetical protein